MLIRIVVFLFSVTWSLPSSANFLCTASSDNFGAFNDGLIFSKQVELLDVQGTEAGHKLLFKNKHFEFWLVGGTMLKIGSQPKKLVNFYVELHSLSPLSIARAKSGSTGGEEEAQLELVRYETGSKFYNGQLLFRCVRYLN